MAAIISPANRALCCECGNLRTVAASFRRRDDNYTCDDNRHPEGWRVTLTLRCAICKSPTRHAALRDYCYDGRPDDEFRDIAETRQHLDPGVGLPFGTFGGDGLHGAR
jgi:hypothetical protein